MVAPLDWGLGHATRCMPLINLLIEKKHNIIIAGNGDSFLLLKKTYPTLTFFELPAYNIKYESGKNAAVQSLLQTPKILRTIKAENKAIKQFIEQAQIDLIISDNRYGVRHENIKSIFICHQIALQAPKPFQWMNAFFLKLHLRQIQKFDELWIPDVETENNLSGKLSHQINFGITHKYIGIQSRFLNYNPTVSFIENIDFDVLVVLSGVEPQRSSLEKKLIEKFQERKEKVLLIQGKTATLTQTSISNITIISYLETNDLFVAMKKADCIICRSGYSTVMDLAALGKKAIFIPAEGQTEQEYLAETLTTKGFSVMCESNNLDLETAMEKIKLCRGFGKLKTDNQRLEDFLKRI